MATAISDVTVHPLSDAIGAEIRGVDLSQPLDPATLAAIRAAWHEHVVVVFRDQTVSNDDQVRFCRYFGELENVRTGKYATPEMKNTMMITNVRDTGFKTALEDGEMWFHHDQCYYEIPARASTLYAMEVPPAGGNTLFANGYKAWETLPADVRAKLEGRRAHHIYDYANNSVTRGANVDPNAPQFLHPVARTHPETGRKALYVNRLMTDWIEGLDPEDSAATLEMLFRHGEDRRFVYEHEWRVGDLLMWDNCCSTHARTWFDPAHRRMMRRITIKGEAVR